MNCCAVSGQERWDRPLLQAVLWMQGRLCGAMAYMASWRDGETEQAGQEETNRQAARLLDQYGNHILRLAYTYLHNMSDAEDVLQDTLLQFLKKDELDETLAAEEREDLSFVWEAVKALPAQYRAAIHLFYYEGYSTRQIGEILGKKETTVRSDLHRGREKLKELLKGAYDFEESV